VLGKASRKSEQRRSLAANRPSTRLLPGSNNFEVENFTTPKNNEPAKQDSTTRTEEMREKRKKDSSRDSIEILKSMRKDRKEEIEFKSPKFP
jgi:hypothetical protein